MDQRRRKQLLNNLITIWKNEVIELKSASNDFSTDKIGRYFRLLPMRRICVILNSRLLMENTSLPLLDVLALDRVQKKLPITDKTIQHLRRATLIEGRKPNIHNRGSLTAPKWQLSEKPANSKKEINILRKK